MRPAVLIRLLLAVAVLIGTVLIGTVPVGPARPAGAEGSEQAAAFRSGGTVNSLEVDLELEASGRLRVREEFVYTLGYDELHGFRRFIPYQVPYDDAHYRTYRFTDIRVEASPAGGRVVSGDPDGVDDLTLSDENLNQVIRIGSPYTNITGRWRYVIEFTAWYTVETVDLNTVGTVEELAWNIVGTNWEVPFERVEARVRTPAAALDEACYTGAYRSVEPCTVTRTAGGLGIVVDRLEPYEAVTLYADFPTGTFEQARPRLVERQTLSRAFRATPATLGGSVLATLLIVGGFGALLAREGRDRRLVSNAYLPAQAEPDTQGLAGFFEKPDGPVQFRPPEGMTPGLCGVLVDEKADGLDVSATIVDLAVRGYLQIEQLGEGRHADFVLRFLRDPDGALTAYESMLLHSLRASADDGAVAISDLRTKFSGEMAAVRRAMYEETMRRGWFRRRPDRVRATAVAVGLALLVAGGLISFFLAASTTFGLLSLPLIAPGLLLLFSSGRLPSRSGEGRRVLELCVGYERFLAVADAEELRFVERQYDYVAGLPYAMVFGITDRWARVLAVLQEQGLDLQPSWFVSGYGVPFHYYAFGHAMADFGSVAASSLSAPAPSSTGGGFSGGGFSGGGGGGGGGGGW